MYDYKDYLINDNGGDGDSDEVTEEQRDENDIGIVAVANAPYNIHCLTVIGQIEGHYILPPQNKTTKYEHIIPALVAIEQDDTIEGLLIILNTVGGDVEAGLALAELIAGMSKPTVSIVVGGGHSIGVPLAVSAKRSFIVPSATMTIHPVRMNGMMLGIPQTLSYFDRMQGRITSFVVNNSRIKSERFLELMMEKDELVMDVGSVVDGSAAVEEGLIDNLGGLSEAITCLYDLIEEWKIEKEKRIEEIKAEIKAEKVKELKELKAKQALSAKTTRAGRPATSAKSANAAKPAKTSKTTKTTKTDNKPKTPAPAPKTEPNPPKRGRKKS